MLSEPKDEIKSDLWIEEKHRVQTALRFRVGETLFRGKSSFQEVAVVHTVPLGRMLLNDGLVMCTEKDEFVYHEMIAHVPLFTHPDPQNVLVIGGGDGGTVREVLRHKSVRKCRLVEIDKMVVDACVKFLPSISKALKDRRAHVTIADGVKFVATTKERFDVVLVDSTDPIGPAAPLFGKKFYSDVRRVLKSGGVVVSQGESPYYEAHAQGSLLGILAAVFKKAHVYNFSNLSYPGGLWSFAYASDELCPVRDFSPERVRRSKLDFQYYNDDLHAACFQLPQFQRKALGKRLTCCR